MSFPLIPPLISFQDSSGNPLASGTIEFRDPTSNDLINSYPTADDADAKTNANANPLTLNARGEAASGIFLEDGVKYKITLKDSAGATVWTIDDVRCPQFTDPGTNKTTYPTLGGLTINTTTPTAIVGIQAYTTGAHSTLRDFTGTSTAAHALQILETLVDDLVEKGSL